MWMLKQMGSCEMWTFMHQVQSLFKGGQPILMKCPVGCSEKFVFGSINNVLRLYCVKIS